jgi:hypothetical protein
LHHNSISVVTKTAGKIRKAREHPAFVIQFDESLDLSANWMALTSAPSMGAAFTSCYIGLTTQILIHGLNECTFQVRVEETVDAVRRQDNLAAPIDAQNAWLTQMI